MTLKADSVLILQAYERQNPQETFEVVVISTLHLALPVLLVEQSQSHEGHGPNVTTPVMTRLPEDRRRLPVDQETELVLIGHEIRQPGLDILDAQLPKSIEA